MTQQEKPTAHSARTVSTSKPLHNKKKLSQVKSKVDSARHGRPSTASRPNGKRLNGTKAKKVDTIPPIKSNMQRKAYGNKKILSRVMADTESRQKQYRKEIKKETKKAVFNGQDITTINVDEYFLYEYLYFRDMELESFDCASVFPNLRMLDLSSNHIQSLDFLANMPALRHLSLSSNALTDLTSLPAELVQLESLAVGNNRIHTLQGMPSLENLRVLILKSNLIENLDGLPILYSLDTIDLRENPVMVNLGENQFKSMIKAMHAFAPLKKVNGEKTDWAADSEEFVNSRKTYGGKLAYCFREGFLPPASLADATAEEGEALNKIHQQAAQELREHQLPKTEKAPLRLYQIGFSDSCEEGIPLTLSCIFKLVDPELSVAAEGFANHTFESDNDQYLYIQNTYIPLDKGMDGKYRATVLLPFGEYEYGFISAIEQEPASKKHTAFSENGEHPENPDRYLFIQWFKLNDTGLFLEIDDANDVSLTPRVDDIGEYLKAQIFCFDTESNLIFSVFDISDQILEAQPQCRSLIIEGEFIEGHTLHAKKDYFGGIEGESKFQWIGGEDRLVSGPEYELKLSDVEHSIRLQYTPVRADGVQGKPVTTESDVISPAEPSVLDLTISGELKEGNTVSVSYNYYGGYEGDSAIQWYRQNGQTQLFEPIEGKVDRDYKITLDDVHHKIQVRVTPISDKGVTGEEASFSTAEPVMAADPSLSSLSITALKLEEDKIVVVEAEYYGGYEGKSLVEWYRLVQNQETEEVERVHIEEASNQQMYKCTFDDVGHKLEVEYTPKREDGVLGKPVQQQSDGIVRSGPPKCTALRIVGKPEQNQTLEVEYVYKGGGEGSSIFRWYRIPSDAVHEEHINAGDDTPINDDDHVHDGTLVGKGKQYTLSLEDTGHRIRLEYIPMRDDGVQGVSVHSFSEVVHSLAPTLSNVRMTGDLNEFEKVTGHADYYGGYEKERRHRWTRVKDGEETVIEDAREEHYIIDTIDVDAQLKYSAQSVSTEDKESEWVDSEVSATIEAQQPSISTVKLVGSPQEGGLIELNVSGEEFDKESSKVEWYKVDEIDETQEIPLDVSDYSYTVTLDDIGYKIGCRFTPIRADLNISGETVDTQTETVKSGEPTAEDVALEGSATEGYDLTVSYKYSGGREGDSIIRWFRVDSTTTHELQDFENNRSYNVSLDDIDCKIKCEITPVRYDGQEGIPQNVESEVVSGAEPSILNLEIVGEASEDQTLQVRYQYFGGVEGSSQKRWYRVNPKKSDDKEVVSIDDQYQIQLDDIDSTLEFEYIPTRQDGARGTPVIESVGPVRAKPAVIKNVEISGNPFVSEVLKVSGAYSGGREGDSMIEWQSSSSRTGPWTEIENASGKSFCPTPDELNAFVRAKYTPVRHDGISGNAVESQPVNIHMGATHLQNVTESVQQAQSNLEQCNPHIHLTHKHMQVSDSESKKNLLKSSYEQQLNIQVNRKEETQFTIIPAPNPKHPTENIVVKAPNQNERDHAVLLCRTFAGFADAALSEEMFGKPFVQAWKKKKNIASALETSQSQVSQTEKPTDDHHGKVYEALRCLLTQDM